jgi:hypothetical protein
VTDPNWNNPTVVPKGLDPKVTARWTKILKGWPHDHGASPWKRKHAEAYEIVAQTVVCNQLSEHAAQIWGKDTAEGIRPTVNWYLEREREAKAKGVTGPALPYFIRPTKKDDFIPGAALFWAHFVDKRPNAEAHMALPINGIPFFTEGKHVMIDGLIEGDWTYHIDSKGHITRTRTLNIFNLMPSLVETQWFIWQHEATVVDRDDRSGKVITFETSNGARMRTWPLESLVNAPTWWAIKHEDWNAFVGYAPDGKILPELDKSLEKILPGRNAF